MKLRDIMVTEVATISPDATISAAAEKLREQSIGCLVVVYEVVKGMLTDRDLWPAWPKRTMRACAKSEPI